VVLAHDYLTQRGGAERVVLSMLRAFPSAPLLTSLYCAEATFPAFNTADIRPLLLNNVAPLRRHHRWALPALAPTFGRAHVDATVTLVSSSGWAHGISTTGRKIVYCYTPARWLYQPRTYLRRQRRTARAALSLMRRPLLRWDRRAALSADRYITCSTVSRDRIRAAYGIEAEVLPAPHTLDAGGTRKPVTGIEPGFLLCVSRLLSYKNIDAVMDAVAGLPAQRLVIVGPL
jgi:glycosyltransferase involved in cell wall biosynthesis